MATVYKIEVTVVSDWVKYPKEEIELRVAHSINRNENFRVSEIKTRLSKTL